MEQRVEAAKLVRELGFEPIVAPLGPPLRLRRTSSRATSRDITGKAGVKRVFLIAGDPPEPEGPFENSLQIIETGLLEKHGIEIVGVGGHPEGHPNNSKAELWEWMERKIAALRERGHRFRWSSPSSRSTTTRSSNGSSEMRARGIDVPVRLGVPGPAGIKRLLGFAKRCGVGASASVMKKYGVSLTNLIGSAGPDKLVNSLDTQAQRRGARPRPPALLPVRRADPLGRMDQPVRREALR